MSLMPRLDAPTISPLDMGHALTGRQDVGRLEYWGAVAGQSFEESLLGGALRNIPSLVPSPDAFVDEMFARRRSGGLPDPTPAEEAQLRMHFTREAEAALAEVTPLTAEQWQASPNFREGIPYEDGMTAERASALAEFYDDMAYADWIRENHDADWISTIGAVPAAIGGAIASPEAFVPIVGPAMRGAIVARLGVVGGRAAARAVEGAVGTAAVLPFISSQQASIGREFTAEEMLLDVAIGALAGTALGTAGGLVERRSISRTSALAAREQVALTDMRAAGEALAGVDAARRQIEAGQHVDVAPPSRAAIDAMLEGLSIQERARFARARYESAVTVAELEVRRLDAEEADAILLRPETTLTPIEEGAIRGDTQLQRDRAREVRSRDRESRRATRGREGTEAPRERVLGPEEGRRVAEEAGDVAMRLRELGVAPGRSRRRVRDLSPIERMALFDPDPRLQRIAQAEIDRRLAENGTTATPRQAPPAAPKAAKPKRTTPAVAARTPDTGDPAADIDARTVAQEIAEEQGIAEDGSFAELDDWKRADAEGDITASERAAYEEAEAMLAKTANAEEVYDLAASCLLRV